MASKLLFALSVPVFSVIAVRGQAAVHQQCGGIGFEGSTTCVSGSSCVILNKYYSQCLPGDVSGSSIRPHATTAAPSAVVSGIPLYGQCAGSGWERPCAIGACVEQNELYSQCLAPSGSGISVSSTAPTTVVSSSSAVSSLKPVSSSRTDLPSTAIEFTSAVPFTSSEVTSVAVTSTSSAVPTANVEARSSKLQLVGVNIAGFDFGCSIWGSCPSSHAVPPLPKYSGHDGPGQMQHFVKDDGYNTFRLPVSWQFLTNDQLTSTLHTTNFAKYDELVQACLATGASCLIDLHNYARYNGKIIGQGGPSNEMFAALWSSIAKKYASNSKIIFGIVNEPHDIPSINEWVATVQAGVTAIRKAGATSQMILLPGSSFSSAGALGGSGFGNGLLKITNLDGSVNKLVFDVHEYIDADSSGTDKECVAGSIVNAWSPLAKWLRKHNRQAFATEIGGGNTASCLKYVCEEVAYLEANTDIFVGYIGWGAGSFSADTYPLSETPTLSAGTWTDSLLVKTCLAPNRK